MNIVIMGTGRCGTSILARMVEAMGWNLPNVQDNVAENIEVKAINHSVCTDGQPFPRDEAKRVVESWPEPWVVKDPRFKQTLYLWEPLFKNAMLLVIDRQPVAVAHSMRKAGWMPGKEDRWAVVHRRHVRNQYNKWSGPKLIINYENLHKAVQLFDTKRGYDHEK